MNKTFYLKQAISLTILLSTTLFNLPIALAHEGHDKAPGESEGGGTGPITITYEAKENLNLEVKEAEIRAIDKNITLVGQIEPIPSRQAAVTSRISGRVKALYVNEGQQVKKGQELVEVESRQPGEPPPRVKYFAPIDGIITDRHAIIGDTVEPDKHLMEVVDLNEVYVEGRIYEGQVPLIMVGQNVRAVVESYSTETFEGKVELLGGSLDPESRTLKVWVRISNPNQKLRPNMQATLHVSSNELAPSIAIPKSAVLGEMGHYFVFVQSEEDPLTFERRNIVVGSNDDLFVEVLEGVLPGDKVVTAGNYQLQYVPAATKKDSKEPSEANENVVKENGFSVIQILLGIVIGFAFSLVVSRFLKRERN